jgi:iron complex outermembrane receptor protein
MSSSFFSSSIAALVVVAAGSAAHAQPSVDPSTCRGTIDGHAVDAATHEPVVAATVRIGAELVATTDDTGRFVLTDRCDGRVTLVVERDDYMPSEGVVDVVGGQASIEIAMSPAGELIEVRGKAPPPEEVRSTAVVSGVELERTRGKSFTAAIAAVPGVTELRTATGVAKPIVRGQFGRRLLLLVDGVRHRAQEWGLDHAPEIDPFVANAIRVVRGAGGVRYGSDAIGGIILVDPPEPRLTPGAGGEAHLIGATNGRGGTFAARVQAVLERLPALSMQFEGSVKRLAAPEAPGYALDNAGALEWSAGATFDYRIRRSELRVSYRHYDAKLGVCSCLRIHSVDDFLAQAGSEEPIGADDFAADFAIGRPHQSVGHDLALARWRWERDGLGSLTTTYSFQFDLRREYDVVRSANAAAQFNFRLATHELEAVIAHDPIHLSDHWHLRGSAGVTAMAQVHHYAGLQLVPDHESYGAGVFATERLVGHDTDLEAGVRYDVLSRTAAIERIDFLRLVRSGQIAMDACGTEIAPARCHSRFHTFVASLGAMRRLADALSVKAEVAIAQRAPNPDEQYLNGTSPTFPVLALGKPDLSPETTYGASITWAYGTATTQAEASFYANVIRDYIYFAPAIGEDGMPIFDTLIRGTFPRFTTRPIDAVFYGVDGGIAVQPLPSLELGGQLALVRAKNIDDDSYLAFVPADHFRGSITYHLPEAGPFRAASASVTGSYVARQHRFDLLADFVPPPAAYVVVGAELGAETRIADQTVRFALQGANLLDARYRDYTSLMRYFADEPGWQVWLRASLFFDTRKKEIPK